MFPAEAWQRFRWPRGHGFASPVGSKENSQRKVAAFSKLPSIQLGSLTTYPQERRAEMYPVWIITVEGKILQGWVTRAVIMAGLGNRLEGEVSLVIDKQHNISDDEMLPVRELLVKVA